MWHTLAFYNYPQNLLPAYKSFVVTFCSGTIYSKPRTNVIVQENLVTCLEYGGEVDREVVVSIMSLSSEALYLVGCLSKISKSPHEFSHCLQWRQMIQSRNNQHMRWDDSIFGAQVAYERARMIVNMSMNQTPTC